MRTKYAVWMGIALLAAFAAAQTAMTNDSVIKMAKAGLSEDIILGSVNGQPGQYRTSADDLIARAADVILKERRKLILVPRDTPFSLIHIRNIQTITEAGGIVCPAIPSFYSKPKTIEEVAMTVINRVIDLMGLENESYRWSEGSE